MISGLDYLRSQYREMSPSQPFLNYQLVCSQAGFKFAENVLQERVQEDRTNKQRAEVSSISQIRRRENQSRFLIIKIIIEFYMMYFYVLMYALFTGNYKKEKWIENNKKEC